MSVLLDLSGLTKAYPGVIANDDVGFDIAAGEIHALLGENGAGKSTLVKMIYGLVRPDSGEMRLHGAYYAPGSPKDARAAGVSMVFQHFSLFDALSVRENIALGLDEATKPRELSQRIRDVSREYGLPLDPDRLIGDLSVGERQRVEIVRCLLQDPRLLIMDEPTSVLTPQEVEILFNTLRLLASRGVAILYISHKLDEIRVLCDRATILRGGKVVGTCIPRDETPRSMAEMMIGEALREPKAKLSVPGRTLLRLNGLSMTSDDPFGVSLRDIHLELHAGEVTGIAGVAGNGQDELLSVLSGEAKVAPGMLMLDDAPIGDKGPNARRALGLQAAPEERLGHAAAPEMTLTENTMLTGRVRQRLDNSGFLKWEATANFARAVISQFDVRTPGVATQAKALSGGNLQKFVIGREVLQKPRVLIVNQPTWGVDAAAAAAIRDALRALAEGGAAVLVISQDLDELMEMSDQFAVIAGGRLSAPRAAGTISIEEIGRLMGGDTSTAREGGTAHAAT
ncbi:ABC transporter ATP-binding protein [Pontivivens insulae]|uniref:Galactose/methyl galactoside import ATP-binding protein MglA n=1 Tax=Pontivivens insulae TaxID=1639689 RepID=A0A2R8AD10_9RHOB|nr:ABC transporter ATP-binding protein [Pontivivens insulae]RED14059.1 nucleoside ABC transporter ATP-binding protein [Pontivivens insulae]SPF30133.1 Galactose/methyl galactoside import ATP-binding protein MglA [Pontivivens insulae]